MKRRGQIDERQDAAGLAADTRGAAYVEFLVAFPPVLILFLSLVQLSLMYVGKLSVRHAATRAARAAVVVIPDDPRFYSNEPINSVEYGGSGGSDRADGFFGGGMDGGAGSPRIRAIRSAAYIPLVPLAPPMSAATQDASVRMTFDRGSLDILAGALVYNRGATSVSFPREPRSQSFRERFTPRELITTRVTYMYHCGVPIVNRFMCDDALSMLMSAPSAIVEGVLGRVTGDSRDRILEPGFDWYRDRFEGRSGIQNGIEELQFAEAPWLVVPWAMRGGRFTILRAEAVMPNQGAGFEYASR